MTTRKRDNKNIFANFQNLHESRLQLAAAELEKTKALEAQHEAMVNEYYAIRDKRAREERERHNLMEAARNDALSTVIKGIYIGALEAGSLTDDGLLLAESMVDKWIDENGGASAILSKNANGTYLLSRITQIVENYAEAEVKAYLEVDAEEMKAARAAAKNSAQILVNNGDKRDIKNFLNKVVDAIDKKADAQNGDEEPKEVPEQKPEETPAEAPAEKPEEPQETPEETPAEKPEEAPAKEESEDDGNEELDIEIDDVPADKKTETSVDTTTDSTEKSEDKGDDEEVDIEIEDDDKDESEEEDSKEESDSEEDDKDDSLNDVDDDTSDTEDIEDTDDPELNEPADDGSDDENITIDGDLENKGKVFDDLDKEEDVKKAVELIRARVADAEETFIRNNAEDKKKVDELINKISDNVKTMEAMSDKNDAKSETKKEIAEESVRMSKRAIDNIRENRTQTVFEKMTRNLTSSIVTNESVLAQYQNESGKLDTGLVVESAKVMYGFLETINTLQLEKVDANYIKNILENM